MNGCCRCLFDLTTDWLILPPRVDLIRYAYAALPGVSFAGGNAAATASTFAKATSIVAQSETVHAVLRTSSESKAWVLAVVTRAPNAGVDCGATTAVAVSTPSVLTVRRSDSDWFFSAASPSQATGDLTVLVRTGTHRHHPCPCVSLLVPHSAVCVC
jgi:hypothetical protein